MLELVLASQTQTYQSNEENQLIYLMTKSPVPWSAAETVWRRNRPAKWGLFLLTSHWATPNLWFLQFNPGRLEQAFNFQAELQDFYNGSTETKSPSGQGLIGPLLLHQNHSALFWFDSQILWLCVWLSVDAIV